MVLHSPCFLTAWDLGARSPLEVLVCLRCSLPIEAQAGRGTRVRLWLRGPCLEFLLPPPGPPRSPVAVQRPWLGPRATPGNLACQEWTREG